MWNHTAVAAKVKRSVYQQCILSKLIYGLESAWLNKRERSMLDSFHVRSLRKIYKIGHSMISRVSNQYILNMHGTVPLSNVLLRRQLFLYGKIARLPASSSLRHLIFQENSNNAQPVACRKRGRPRSEWSVELSKIVQRMIPNETVRSTSLLNRDEWHRKVWQFTELSINHAS